MAMMLVKGGVSQRARLPVVLIDDIAESNDCSAGESLDLVDVSWKSPAAAMLPHDSSPGDTCSPTI
jgi:hypothetical protein